MKLPTLPPEILRILWEYQVTPTAQLLRALIHGPMEWGYPGAVDLSDVGIGKSFQDYAAALLTGRRVVVLTVSAGLNGWERTASLFGQPAHFIGTYEAIRGGWRPELVTRAHTDKLMKWKNPENLVLILDEAQRVKGDSGLTTAAIGGAVAQKIPIIAASATMASSPVELRIAGRITGLHQGGRSWKDFLTRSGCRYNEAEDFWQWDKRRTDVLEEINRLLIPQRGCRVRKEDTGEQPGTTIRLCPLAVPEGPEIEKAWKDLEKQIANMKKARDDHGRIKFPRQVITNTKRAKRMALWKRSEMALVPFVAEMAIKCLDEGKSVVLFFSFTESRLAMGKLLGTQDGFFGGQTKPQRKKIEEAFQANRIRVLLCNIGAAGASLSLQDLTGDRPRETFIFATDSYVKLGQAPGRVDRAGGQTHSLQHIICIKGGMSERMVRTTLARLDNLSILNDGDGQGRLLE